MTHRRSIRSLRAALAVAATAALVLVLGATAPAQAASRTQSDSNGDVLKSDPNKSVSNYSYWRTDIEAGTLSTSGSATTVQWALDYYKDDLAYGSYTRKARVRVETLIKKTRTGVKTSKENFVATYVAGDLEPLTLEKQTADGLVAVECDDLYYESDDELFSIEIANSCLGTKLYRVGTVLETHSVDKGTSVELADTLQIKPVLY